MTTPLASRGHRRFRALVILEVAIWGFVIASQVAIIWSFYVR
jgi:hypothetical protein